MASSAEEEATISIPSLAFVAVLGYFIYRYFFSSSTTTSDSSATSSSTSRGTTPGIRFTPAQVDQISQMFPQLSRRDIMWDLHRNRGSVQATTERVLMGRGLDPVSCKYRARDRSSKDEMLIALQAPPSFQPPPSFMTTPSDSTATTVQTTASKSLPPDLITRYNLQTKINSKGKEKEEESPPPGWASNKDARQKMLQRRRDEMILAARRKLQEKEADAPADADAQVVPPS
ncbi:putative AMFR protein [Cladophialophora carrionii]|uniref:Coupling of ubiquitin conjugation to ER degradation protein 1 n=1 Tax=Cladophialophora carrionii TaxID=86049 RepID=A0A1C1CRF0_9EURO|nr:putative AMFR protein [Cladophialophora carrionii]